jgi:ABC-type phosphate transport system permease subunit
MNRSSRSLNVVLATACVALTAIVLAVPAGAATIYFEKETLRAYEGQLRHHEVHAVTFHPGSPAGHLHISLNNGGHMTVEYSPAQQASLVAAAETANTRVKVATVKVKKTTAVKHKLRYIAGGILIVVIVIVLVVLLIGRRRALTDGDPHAPQGESAAS